MNQLMPFGYSKNLSYRGIKIKYENVVEMGQGGWKSGN